MTGSSFGWTVGEDVSQMGVAFCAADFYPIHAVRGVPNTGDPCPFNFLIETGPSATGFEFGRVRKQGRIADLTVVIPFACFAVEVT